LNIALSAIDRTESAANVPVLRRIFSFPVMLASLLAMLAVLTVQQRFDDPDMWWHLKTGEVIWTTHTIPTTDLFSYTTNHHAWIPHEWLSQVLIYGAYRWGGYSGLMVWLCFFTAALLIAGYTLCSLYSGNSKVALIGALAIWLFGTVGFAVRPHMIGYLLLIIELLLLHLGQTRNRRWLLGLPPLFAIWVNCHGSFFFGFLLLGLFLFCSFFDFQIGLLLSSQWEIRCRRSLILAFSLSAAALFLNPAGVQQVLYPLNTMFFQPINLSEIAEWKPLQWDGRGISLLVVLVSIFLLLILRQSKLFLHEMLLLILGTWLALTHERMEFVFGILAAPILSRLLMPVWDSYDFEKDRPWPNVVLITISILIMYVAFPNRQQLVTQVNNGNPVKAVEFIRSRHLTGHMLNSYRFGGYLIWALPEQPVFIDGRADLFEWAGVLGDFSKWATLQNDPDTLLEKYKIDFCLLERESPMVHVMAVLNGWKVIYSDDLSVIFARQTPLSLRSSN
jgi:hypothetical protein